MKKIKIISIVGSGRSGSTILSLLLSQNKDVFNLGQSRDMWRALGMNAPCSCSSALRDCPFWSRVAWIGNGCNAHIDTSKLNRQNRAFMRDAESVTNWTDDGAVKALMMRHNDFFEGLQRLCSAYRDISGADTFVDSSKSPEIALAFSLLENVDLYVLNLVRDPRAVACSWERKHHDRTRTIRMCKEWKRRQNILRGWSTALGGQYLQVRYEEFVKSPRMTLSSILAWAGVDTNTDYFTSANTASISWAGQHMFPPANEGVLAKKEIDVTISAPREWRKMKYFPIHFVAIRHAMPTSLGYIIGLD